MLEAAVSSAICHPNIVQTYDYQVVDTYQSASMLRTEANRVSLQTQLALQEGFCCITILTSCSISVIVI